MTCRETYAWLLASRENELLPADVERHLQKCPTCLRHQQQLALLDHQVARLPSPPDNPSARRAFIASLEPKPQQRPHGLFSRDAKSAERSAPLRVAAKRMIALAASIALLAAGIVIGYGVRSQMLSKRQGSSGESQAQHQESVPDSSKSSEGSASRVSPAMVVRGPSEKVLQKTLSRNVELAPIVEPDQQATVLLDLSEDIRDEAVFVVQREAYDELPFLVNLYNLVLRNGLGDRMRHLTARQLAALVPQIGERLDADAKKLKAVGEQTPNVARQLLRSMSELGQTTAQALRDRDFHDFPDGPPPAFQPVDSLHTLLAASITNCLLLVREDDTLHRANLFLDLGDVLTQTLLVVSATGESDCSAMLGKCLGDVMEMGVAESVNVMPEDKMDDARKAELKQVKERTDKTTDLLEKNAQSAMGPGKVGLQKALEASQHGRGKAMQAGPGKGKGSKPKDKVPPGLSKSSRNN